MNSEVIGVFNKLNGLKKDQAGRVVNGNCKTGYAYVHTVWGTNGKKAALQLSCAPVEYHNKAAGRHKSTGIVNGYRIEGITGCEATGRSAVEVAADILADALTDLASFQAFLETSPCDAYEGALPILTRKAGRNVSEIVKAVDERLVRDNVSLVAKKFGKRIMLELAEKFGRDTVKTDRDTLTINEFELRYGL